MKKIAKVFTTLHRKCIQKSIYINTERYMKMYIKFLRKYGMIINGTPNYIANDVHFDGTDYSLISLGNGCTISREVLFLTHDFCMHTVLKGLRTELSNDLLEVLDAKDNESKLLTVGKIIIGDYSFIGARVTLLPGTEIGKNCIIGSGSVVKGKIEDNSIVIGNPARVYSATSDWLKKKAEKMKEQI